MIPLAGITEFLRKTDPATRQRMRYNGDPAVEAVLRLRPDLTIMEATELARTLLSDYRVERKPR